MKQFTLLLLLSVIAICSGYHRGWRRTVHYHLWIGDDIHETHEKTFSIHRTFFVNAMRKMERFDKDYKFDYTRGNHGIKVTSIGVIKNDHVKRRKWILYELPEEPDRNTPPGDEYRVWKSPSELRMKGGFHYLYWYQSY